MEAAKRMDESVGSTTASGDQGQNKDHTSWIPNDKFVYVWMAVVVVMIGITAAIVIGSTYYFLSSEEEHAFESTFEQHSVVIAENLRFHSQKVIESLETFSETITSFAGAASTVSGVSWPFITIPDFDRRGKRAKDEAYIEMLGFSPVVTYEDRHAWGTFTEYEQDWLGKGEGTMTNKEIYRLDEETGKVVPDDNILNLPFWMTSPVPHNASLINFNLLSDSLYNYLFNAMIESDHIALSAVYNNQRMFDHLFEPGKHDDSHNYIHGIMNADHDHSESLKADHFEGDRDEEQPKADRLPHSILMAPVYDSFNTSTRSLSGVLHGILPWDSYLTELLPYGVVGIYCIVKNSCGQTFTFQLDGPHAKYVGEGDQVVHTERYDSYAMEVQFGSDFMGQETRTYRQCFYSLTVYPSHEFEMTFESNRSEKFTSLLALVFAVLALFFLIFVWFVQRRQQRLMGVALRTSSIISGLFPDNVRDRIMQSAAAQANQEMTSSKSRGLNSTKHNMKGLLYGTKDTSFCDGGDSSISETNHHGIIVHKEAPIADCYPACTVFFADLVGFTSWSSSREPQQVFVLLETLYGAFDEIAKRRRIFKVETIGDCYVAVTGLPNPRQDHALAMARFANDCLVKSSEVFNYLDGILGPGTRGLNLRIGIHSGKVTAGVLRGEKGRFQLFGDSVNTAARMESNSAPGKILCSAATATLIMEAGKAHWVTERPDKVNAKGKGTMVTYWVNAKAERSVDLSLDSQTDCLSNDQESASYNASMPTTIFNNSTHQQLIPAEDHADDYVDV